MSVHKREKSAKNAKGFKSNFEYLEEYFDVIHRRVCLYAVREMDSILDSGSSRFMDDTKEFYVKLGLKSKKDLPEKIEKMRVEYLEGRECLRKRIDASSIPLHLENIADGGGLSEFEKDVVAMALAVATDSRFNTLAEQLRFQSRNNEWEVKDYLNVLTDSFEERVKFRRYFMSTGKLNEKGFLLMDFNGMNAGTENDFLDMSINLPRRISSAIYGEEEPEDMILAFSEVITPDVSLEHVVLDETLKAEVTSLVDKRDLFLKRRAEWGIEGVLSYGMGTIMLFSGMPGTGKTMLAHALAKHADLKLLQVNVPRLLDRRGAFEEYFKMLLREAALQNAILFFDEADELFSDRAINANMPTILREFERFDGIAILATNRKQILDEALDRRILYKLDFGIPTPELRETIWREHLPEALPLGDDVDLGALAEKYEFSGGYIKNAVLLATQRAIARTGDKAKVFQDDLRWAAKRQRDSQLERFADKLTPKVTMDQIIAPKKLKENLERIVGEYRNTSKIFEKWNFKSTINRGRAVTALFYGEPGVGKTMAAEAIAYELGMNLYPVNISAIVSKWVGETAKNLKKVFEAAKDSESVLLFDEADALFSARLEGGSHHAVYINQEVDTLLQEIERFDGIVLLTTNMPERLDKAFKRRIRHHLEFAFPSAEARAEIWRHHFPKEAPLAKDVDFAVLGREFALTGGVIRNLAVKAAFEAACEKRGKITMAMLRNIIKSEEDPGTKKQSIGFNRVA